MLWSTTASECLNARVPVDKIDMARREKMEGKVEEMDIVHNGRNRVKPEDDVLIILIFY